MVRFDIQQEPLMSARWRNLSIESLEKMRKVKLCIEVNDGEPKTLVNEMFSEVK